MTTCETLAAGVENCKDLAARFYPGFDDGNHVRQAAHLPNHFAWTLGHLALYLNSLANELDGQGKPGSGFGPGGRGAGLFDHESIGFNSTPVADADKYPSVACCIEIFERACDRLGAALRNAKDSDLERSVRWGKVEISMSAAVMRHVFHVGAHTGQILDLRRALGLGRVLG